MMLALQWAKLAACTVVAMWGISTSSYTTKLGVPPVTAHLIRYGISREGLTHGLPSVHTVTCKFASS